MTADGIAIERSKHAQEFVIIGNQAARDNRLSFRARGLHHHLLSLPPGWRVTTAQLAKDNPEGREAIRTALNELVKLGYVTREKRQGERGRWSTTMTVHDVPQDATSGDDSTTATEDGFPGAGNPVAGGPDFGELGAIQKTVNENGKDLKMVQGRASRRAHASGERATRTVDQIVREIREAVAQVHGQREAGELSDDEALGLHFTYVAADGREVRDITAYMSKILADTPNLDSLLANSEPACATCVQWESNCRCPAAA